MRNGTNVSPYLNGSIDHEFIFPKAYMPLSFESWETLHFWKLDWRSGQCTNISRDTNVEESRVGFQMMSSPLSQQMELRLESWRTQLILWSAVLLCCPSIVIFIAVLTTETSLLHHPNVAGHDLHWCGSCGRWSRECGDRKSRLSSIRPSGESLGPLWTRVRGKVANWSMVAWFAPAKLILQQTWNQNCVLLLSLADFQSMLVVPEDDSNIFQQAMGFFCRNYGTVWMVLNVILEEQENSAWFEPFGQMTSRLSRLFRVLDLYFLSSRIPVHGRNCIMWLHW